MCPPRDTVLGPKMDPKMGPRAAQNWIPFWTHFWCNFGVAFGGILGAIWAPRLAHLEEPKRAKWSSERPKKRLSKKWFSHRTVCIFSLLRPPKRAPRGPEDCQRASRGSSEAKKKNPQRELKKGQIFGPFLIRFWGPFWGPKFTKKCSEKGSRK